ncbi:lantibiotic immunity ABC transporter MutG family permease subunit [Clostridium sp. C105KSO13]|uniref:lantibiotic immunity ABC transporter MutG family permease subunit n=1 Tax=Clostridium sp. C105KSO13 TaxID=1776045 RepID=UPI0007407F49|nr:lantibiotic immunity ABC transporter MutG family permease subunit [Clostridium sp. C105KSO13]CUX27537.1 ABC-2 family transporter protein [Clostridium sp. C105KSO13]
MGKLGRAMASEFLKMRRTWILWIHVVMPVTGIFIFLLYYRYAGGTNWGKISGYMEVLALVCPTLVGIICALAADQEKEAGHLQNLFGVTKSRCFIMAEKLALLLICNLAALFLAAEGFGIGFGGGQSNLEIPGNFYVIMTVFLWLPQFFAYCFHLYLGLRFSKGITIGAGIVESLLAALFLTGMGDEIWVFFPCAWAERFIMYYTLYIRGKINISFLTGQVKVGIILAGLLTLAGGVLFFAWIHVYEGSGVED